MVPATLSGVSENGRRIIIYNMGADWKHHANLDMLRRLRPCVAASGLNWLPWTPASACAAKAIATLSRTEPDAALWAWDDFFTIVTQCGLLRFRFQFHSLFQLLIRRKSASLPRTIPKRLKHTLPIAGTQLTTGTIQSPRSVPEGNHWP